jgi:hypothetical protein
MTTDLGLGVSSDSGTTLADICNGIEAVQVNDFVMNSDKSIGWTASKAGLRKVMNLTGTAVWGAARWPDGAGFQARAESSVPLSGCQPLRAGGGDGCDGHERQHGVGIELAAVLHHQRVQHQHHRVHCAGARSVSVSVRSCLTEWQTGSTGFCFRSYIQSIVTHPSDGNIVFFGIRSPEVRLPFSLARISSHPRVGDWL